MRAGPPPSVHGGPRVSRCCRSQPSGDPALTHRARYAPRPSSSLLRQAEAHLAPGPPASHLLGLAPWPSPWARESVLSESSAKPPAHAEPPPPRPARPLPVRPQTPVRPHWAAPAPPRPRTLPLSPPGTCVACSGTGPTRPAVGIRPVLDAPDRLREPRHRCVQGGARLAVVFRGLCLPNLVLLHAWPVAWPGPPAAARHRVSGTLRPLSPSHSGRPTAP